MHFRADGAERPTSYMARPILKSFVSPRAVELTQPAPKTRTDSHSVKGGDDPLPRQFGYSDTTTTKVAADAGLSHGAMLHHLKNDRAHAVDHGRTLGEAPPPVPVRRRRNHPRSPNFWSTRRRSSQCSTMLSRRSCGRFCAARVTKDSSRMHHAASNRPQQDCVEDRIIPAAPCMRGEEGGYRLQIVMAAAVPERATERRALPQVTLVEDRGLRLVSSAGAMLFERKADLSAAGAPAE